MRQGRLSDSQTAAMRNRFGMPAMRSAKLDFMPEARDDGADEFRPVSAELKRLIRRGWWLIVLGTATGLAIGLFRLRTTPPVYRAGAQLHVAGSQVLEASGPNVARLVSQRINTQLSTPIGILKSDQLLEEAVRRGNLMELESFEGVTNFIARMHRTLGVWENQTKGTSVIDLAFDAATPEDAEAVLNALIAAYKTHHRDWLDEAETAMLAALAERKKALDEEYQKKQAGRRAFQLDHGDFALGTKDLDLKIRQLGDTAAALSQLELKRIEAEVRLAYLGIPVATPIVDSPSSANRSVSLTRSGGASGRDDTVIPDRELRTLLRAERQKLEVLEREIGPDHPAHRRARERIARLEQEAVQGTRAVLKQHAEQKVALEKKLAAQRQVILASDEDRVELRLIDNELARIESLISDVDDHIRAVQFLDSYGAIEVAVLRAPRAASTPIAPNPTRMVTVPALIGVLCGLALAYWFAPDDRDPLTSPIEQLEQSLGVPVLGVVPWHGPKPLAARTRADSTRPRGRSHTFVGSPR